MGLKGQRDRFAEAHLSAPALFTHHLRSERRASQELSCSQNAAAPHIGGGDVEGSFGGAPPHLLFITRSSDKTCRQNLNKWQERTLTREGLQFGNSTLSALMPQI